MTREEIITAVKRHATEHYEDGWDVVVECYSDDMIAEVIGHARTVTGAIKAFSDIVSVHEERVADARISSGEFPADWDGPRIKRELANGYRGTNWDVADSY